MSDSWCPVGSVPTLGTSRPLAQVVLSSRGSLPAPRCIDLGGGSGSSSSSSSSGSNSSSSGGSGSSGGSDSGSSSGSSRSSSSCSSSGGMIRFRLLVYRSIT